MKVSELFYVHYGTSLELNRCKQVKDGINFVSRTAKNNGVTAIVEHIPDLKPLEVGLITVAANGNTMSSFVQNKPFYTGYHIFCLKPKKSMTLQEKIFYCMCLRHNKYRFSYGRQANQTLKDLELPDKIPEWVNKASSTLPISKKSFSRNKIHLSERKWKFFRYDDRRLFKIERGRGAYKKDIVKNDGKTPYITALSVNNGLTGKFDMVPKHQGNVISVNRDGEVGEAFYQSLAFCSTEAVHVLLPNFKLNQFIAMFLISLIRMEKFKYNYGRKWGLERMNKSIIKLPVDESGNPDWKFMENYIKSLPYSSNL